MMRRPDFIAFFVVLAGVVSAIALNADCFAQPPANGVSTGAEKPSIAAKNPSEPQTDIGSVDPLLNWESNPTTATTAAKIPESPSLIGAVLRMFGALALVLAVIALAAWLGRRYLPAARGATSGPNAIQVLSVRSLGARRSLMIVRVRGHCLLLGCTPSAITRVADLDAPPATESDEPSAGDFETMMALEKAKDTD